MQTQHAREALNDAVNLKELARSVTIQASSLDDVSRRYDFGAYAASVKGKFTRSVSIVGMIHRRLPLALIDRESINSHGSFSER